jgi:Protein of unknown function (DUF2934)
MAPRKTSKAQSKTRQAPVMERTEAGAPSNGNLTAPPMVANGHHTASFESAHAANGSTPKLEEIQMRAYQIFMARGGTHGQDWADWFRAEQELKGMPV